jgi:hypothetical protein
VCACLPEAYHTGLLLLLLLTHHIKALPGLPTAAVNATPYAVHTLPATSNCFQADSAWQAGRVLITLPSTKLVSLYLLLLLLLLLLLMRGFIVAALGRGKLLMALTAAAV